MGSREGLVGVKGADPQGEAQRGGWTHPRSHRWEATELEPRLGTPQPGTRTPVCREGSETLPPPPACSHDSPDLHHGGQTGLKPHQVTGYATTRESPPSSGPATPPL